MSGIKLDTSVVSKYPICGIDFCDYCGDCLHCYGGDPCMGTPSEDREHLWVKQETNDREN